MGQAFTHLPQLMQAVSLGTVAHSSSKASMALLFLIMAMESS